MRAADLERLFARSLAELDLAKRVAAVLRADEPRIVRVVAVGKGAPAMAAGAIEACGERIERCLVVTPEGTDATEVTRVARRARVSLDVMHAAHPVPDARSVRAAEACFDAVRTNEPRTIVVLVSGGTSALACAPAPGITLRTKRAVTRAMLASGASVQELNVVRKHLSRIKGGGLARAAAPNEIVTLVASDVIGGTAADVGSGPSIIEASPTSVATARRILRRFAPPFADLPLVRLPSREPSDATIVVSPEELARVYARLLRARGVSVRLLPSSQAPVDELAREYVRLAHGRRGGARAFVRAAEPSVVVPARCRDGRGGRSTHLAALVGQALSGSRPVLFAALASDGIDGNSGCGGAIVDERFDARRATRAIARFDTGPLHRALGTAVPSRPSGHNLADLHVVLVK